MSSPAIINVDDLIDRQPLRLKNILILGLLLLALLADGFDLQVLSFAAPGLVRDWGTSRAALAPVFSANLFGMMIGAALFGWVGDRFGRKRTIVAGSLLYGAACLSCLGASSLIELGALRFITGVGLGGVLPNVIALTAEVSPRRWRAMFTSLVVIGMSLGSSLPSVVATMLVPQHGWQVLFLVGGVAPLVIALLICIALPESLMFLAHRGHHRELLEQRVRRLDPSLVITPETRFEVRGSAADAKPGLGKLFAGDLAFTTPCLWLMFAGTLLAIFLMTSWMPLLFEDAGLKPTQSAQINGLYHLSGTAAALATAVLLGRLGLAWVLTLLVIGCAGVAGIALTGFSPTLLTALVAASGFGLVGCQTALNASAGLIYPSSFRPTGVGAALSVGRIGSITGPLVGGAAIAAGVSTQSMFLLPLLPIGIAIAATIVLLIRRIDIRTESGGLSH
jgi:AAHS family 4-hydroxybenzoate transporter-like MFS transporter